MVLIAFFVYWCTLVNLLCKVVTWLKFLDVPIYGSGMQLCGPGHLK